MGQAVLHPHLRPLIPLRRDELTIGYLHLPLLLRLVFLCLALVPLRVATARPRELSASADVATGTALHPASRSRRLRCAIADVQQSSIPFPLPSVAGGSCSGQGRAVALAVRVGSVLSKGLNKRNRGYLLRGFNGTTRSGVRTRSRKKVIECGGRGHVAYADHRRGDQSFLQFSIHNNA